MSYVPIILKYVKDRSGHRGGGGGEGCLIFFLVPLSAVAGFLFCIVCVVNGWVLVICQ